MLDSIISFFSSYLDDPLLIAIILGALPFSEVRGAAIYAFSIKEPSLIIPAIFSNILVCPLILIFWKILRIQKIASFLLGKSLDAKLHSFSKSYESQGTFALIIFIGLPFPATGVYTGTLLAEILGIKRIKILMASIAGVLLSSLIMYILLSKIFI